MKTSLLPSSLGKTLKPYSKYWPSFAGVFFFALLGSLLWPKGGVPLEAEGLDTAPQKGDPVVKAEAFSRRASQEATEEKKKALAPRKAQGETRFFETTEAHTKQGPAPRALQQEDKEVQVALGEVEIEMYQADWCSDCRDAKKYLKENGLSFKSYDVESNVMVKEKARRLSGQKGIPVIVIDGEVSAGFSEKGMAKLLSAAVERRVHEQ